MDDRVSLKVDSTVHKDVSKICKEVLFPRVNICDYVEQALKEKNERTLKEQETKQTQPV